MATAKKTAPKKKKEMKAAFDLFVYRSGTANYRYEDRIYIFAEDPSGGATAVINANAKGEVAIDTHKVDVSKAVKSYCIDFIKQMNLDDLPLNQLVKWSVAASVVVPDKAALKAALLKAAEKV